MTEELTLNDLEKATGGAGSAGADTLEDLEASPAFGPLKSRLKALKQEGRSDNDSYTLSEITAAACRQGYKIKGSVAITFIKKYWKIV